MNVYGSLLKRMIRFTNFKLTSLAEIVGYDTSYISKWCNKDKLPAAKAAGNVNKSLAEVFAKEIFSQDDVDAFVNEFGIEYPDSVNQLTDIIHHLLKDSYKAAFNNHTESNKIADTLPYRVLITPAEINQFFDTEIRDMLSSIKDNLVIYCTMDICQMIDHYDFNISDISKTAATVNVKCGFNMNQLSVNTEYIPKIYSLINYYNDIDFDFYDNTGMIDMNLLVVKDLLAVQCSVDKNGKITLATIISNPTEVNTILAKIQDEFNAKKLLIHSTNSDDLFYSGYRTEFYAHRNFQIFLTKGFEFLLPQPVIPRLIEKSVELGFDSGMQQLIAHLGITWEEIFEKGTVDFYLLKTKLLQYVQDGIFYFADISYKMSKEERIEHINNVMRIADNNPNIRFHIIDDDMIPTIHHLMNLSVFNNHKKLFLKNTSTYLNNETPRFYTVLNDQMIHDISHYLTELMNVSYCNTYDAEKLHKFFDTYGNMINRMISVSD